MKIGGKRRVIKIKKDCVMCHGLGKKVADHDHTFETNNYRGAAHNKCNLQFRINKLTIPVIAHNAMGYDIHFIIQEWAKRKAEYKTKQGVVKRLPRLKPIAKSEMKFVNLQFGIFNFIDSLNFFTHTNLETLINFVANREEKSKPDGTTYWDCSKEDLSVFKIKNEALKVLYPNIPTSVFDITTKKGKDTIRLFETRKTERKLFACLRILAR